MRRGDLYWVDLEPVIGSEANGTGPAVIVSNDAANRAVELLGSGVVAIVPVTSNVDRVRSFQVLLRASECGLAADSKAHAEQVRAITTARLRGRIGSIPAERMRQLDDAIRLHLAL